MHHTRTYSISSPPERDDDCITITVKATAGGRVSPHLVRNVAPGAYLPLGLPQGDFVLPDAVPVRPLFITAGSGITPIMSMLRSYAARGAAAGHRAPALRAARVRRDLRRRARRAGEPAPALSAAPDLHARARRQPRPASATSPRRQLDQLCPDWRERDAYACGPQGLLDGAGERTGSDAGLGRRLHIERFHAPWAELPAGITGGVVRFARSDVAVEPNGRMNLLRVAEDAGLNPPHGCRMGICHSCDTRLVSGCVRDLRTGALVNEPGATVQICVSAAAGDVELDL